MKLLVICLLISFGVSAQVDTTKFLTPVNGNGFQWKNTRSDSSARLPRDTFRLRMADSGSIAWKNGRFWQYSGFKWDSLKASVAASALLTAGDLSPLFTTSESSGVITFNLTAVTGPVVFGRLFGTSGAPSYLTSLDSTIVTNLHSQSYYDTRYIQNIIGGGGALTFESGLLQTANTVVALHNNALWNANKWQGFDVSAVQPTDGQIPQWNAAETEWQWVDGTGVGGGSGGGPTNLYFTGPLFAVSDSVAAVRFADVDSNGVIHNTDYIYWNSKVTSVTGTAVDNTDPQNPVINLSGGGDLQAVTDLGDSTTNNIRFTQGNTGIYFRDAVSVDPDIFTRLFVYDYTFNFVNHNDETSFVKWGANGGDNSYYNFPTTGTAGASRYMPLSVNGVYPDATGDITIIGGGGSPTFEDVLNNGSALGGSHIIDAGSNLFIIDSVAAFEITSHVISGNYTSFSTNATQTILRSWNVDIPAIAEVSTISGNPFSDGSDVGVQLRADNSTSESSIKVSERSIRLISDSTYINFLAGTGSRTVVASSTGYLTAPVSDGRLKKDVIPISTSTDVLALLEDETKRGVFYSWINPARGTNREIGFVAQCFEDIPGITGTITATGYKYINYERITAILWEQNRLLLKRIEKLEKK